MANPSSIPKIISINTLIDNAKAQSDKAPHQLKKCVYCYYIARYLTSYWEVRASPSCEIPIQIWNEYRNTLDHFMRHVTDFPDFSYNALEIEPKESGQNLESMYGHIQRAALDAMKLVIAKVLDDYDRLQTTYSMECLTSADDGEFFKTMRKHHIKTENLFLSAKTMDSNLGGKDENNNDVLSRYLKATECASELASYITDHSDQLDKLESAFAAARADASNQSDSRALFINILAGLFVAVIIATLSYMAGSHSSPSDIDVNEQSQTVIEAINSQNIKETKPNASACNQNPETC